MVDLRYIVAENLIENPLNLMKVFQKEPGNYHPDNLQWSECVYGKPIIDKKNGQTIEK